MEGVTTQQNTQDHDAAHVGVPELDWVDFSLHLPKVKNLA